MKFKNINKLFILIISYKLLKVTSYETHTYYNSPLCKQKHVWSVRAMGVKAHMDPFFTLISGCLIVKSLEGKYQA
jgi:hypothetical protein